MERKSSTYPNSFNKIKESLKAKGDIILHEGNRIPENWKELSHTKKMKEYHNWSNHKVVLSVRKEKIYLFFLSERIQRFGRNFYKKSVIENGITLTDKEIKTGKCGYNLEIIKFYETIGITWVQSLPSCYLVYLINSNLMKAIISNRIYNKETLVKRIGTQIYKVKNVEWKLLAFHLEKIMGLGGYQFNPYDLYLFTKDINNSLRAIKKEIEKNTTDNNLSLLKDLLLDAIKLDKKVDFSWSEKRMNQEHLNMTRELMEEELREKEAISLYDETIKKGIETTDIKLLSSEKEVFLEGKMMGHCVYTNYFNRINKKQYLAFHMHSPEECTIGIRVNQKGEPEFDQVYLSHNRRVADETREKVLSFFEKKKEAIISLLKASPAPEVATTKWIEPTDFIFNDVEDENMPF